MKTLNLLIVANNNNWASWPQKIEEFKNWFAPKVNLEITLKNTNFSQIPFVDYPYAVTGIKGIESGWYDKNITSMALGYDMVLFVVNTTDWPADTRARGWRTDKDNGVVEMHIRADENEHNYYPDGRVVGCFFDYGRHEVLHGLFMLSGQNDTVHYWWDRGQLENCLSEIALQEESPERESLYSKIKFLIRAIVQTINPSAPVDPLKPLIEAMITVESQGNDYAVGDVNLADKAYGCLQIRKPCLDDVNAYFHTNYKPEDMLGNRALSTWTFRRYMEIYATSKRLGHTPTFEDMSRIWNGGPSGWASPSTVSYWGNVNNNLK